MMNKLTILENSRLICEFLELRIVDKRAKKDPTYVVPFSTFRKIEYWPGGGETIEVNDEIRLSETLFHCNWSWIMEVVEKIEKIHSWQLVITKSKVAVRCSIGQQIIYSKWNHESESDTKVEAVYKACVAFIKWYNENKR
jgi:hypothetical protein